MESLPLEMVERIAEQLTPQDLARCAAVCRKWYDIFNQDCLWKMHCVAELEEHLRTTPCVATPKFVSPEDENSTLPPICQWKLAFLRENHLWMNWARVEQLKDIQVDNTHDKADVEVFDNKNILNVKFLTDSQVVIWYKTYIEIMDVSVKPAVCIAKSDTVYILDGYRYSVFGTTGLHLLLEKNHSVEVYEVDLPNKLIKLNRRILFKDPDVSLEFRLVKEHFYFILNDHKSVFQVFDLYSGEQLKEDPWPGGLDEADAYWTLESSSTSDFIAIFFQVEDFNKFHIYNIKQLTSFPGFEVEMVIEDGTPDYLEIALHQNWLAYVEYSRLTVQNMLTGELVFRHREGREGDAILGLHVCVDSFIFIASSYSGCFLKSYSPSRQTLTTVCEAGSVNIQKVIHNKVAAGYDEHVTYVWVFSGRKVKKYRLSYNFACCKVNGSFTKMVAVNYLNSEIFYVRSLW